MSIVRDIRIERKNVKYYEMSLKYCPAGRNQRDSQHGKRFYPIGEAYIMSTE